MGIRWNFVFGFEMSVFLRDTWRGCANSFVIERRSHLPITSSGRHVCAMPKTWGVCIPIGWLIWYNHTMRVNMRLYILFTHILYTLPPRVYRRLYKEMFKFKTLSSLRTNWTHLRRRREDWNLKGRIRGRLFSRINNAHVYLMMSWRKVCVYSLETLRWHTFGERINIFLKKGGAANKRRQCGDEMD